MRSIIFVLFIFLTFLSKAQWMTLPFNSGFQNHAINFINKDTGFVSCGIFQGPPPGTNHTQLYKTKDGGYTWQMIYDDYSNTPISQLNFFTENFGVYRRWQDVMMKTYNGGVSGYSILSGGQVSAGSKFQALDSTKYSFTGKDNIRYTSNGGASWTTRSLLPYIPNNWGDNFSQFANLKNGFVCLNIYTISPTYTEVKFCKTTDSCQTLQTVYSKTITGGYYPDAVVIKFINDSTAMMLNNDLVLKVRGFGNTIFDTIHRFTSPERAFRMDIKDNIIIISGNYGTLLTSVDSGSTFQMSSVSPTPIEFSIADAKLGIVYALTASNTIIKLGGLTTSIKKQETLTAKIFPNPATNFIHLQSNTKFHKNTSLEFFDYSGRSVYQITPDDPENIDISYLNNGYYICKITSGEQVQHVKLIKE
jgi:hypothetical protein